MNTADSRLVAFLSDPHMLWYMATHHLSTSPTSLARLCRVCTRIKSTRGSTPLFLGRAGSHHPKHWPAIAKSPFSLLNLGVRLSVVCPGDPRIAALASGVGARLQLLTLRFGSLTDLAAILSPCLHLHTLKVEYFGNIRSIGPVSCLQGLRSLRMHSLHRLTNLEPLAACACLTSLAILRCPAVSLEGLAGVSGLQEVSVKRCALAGSLEVALHGSRATLRRLALHECARVTHLRQLFQGTHSMPSLRSLEVMGCDELEVEVAELISSTNVGSLLCVSHRVRCVRCMIACEVCDHANGVASSTPDVSGTQHEIW